VHRLQLCRNLALDKPIDIYDQEPREVDDLGRCEAVALGELVASSHCCRRKHILSIQLHRCKEDLENSPLLHRDYVHRNRLYADLLGRPVLHQTKLLQVLGGSVHCRAAPLHDYHQSALLRVVRKPLGCPSTFEVRRCRHLHLHLSLDNIPGL
jgi:hypothetical protein